MSKYLTPEELENIKSKVREKAQILASTCEGEHRSHANDGIVIIDLLFKYVTGNRAFGSMIHRLYPSFQHDREHNEVDLSEFGLEIFTTASDVLKAYEDVKGDFFAYFDFAMRNTLIRAVGETLWDLQHGGMTTVYGEKQRSISRIIQKIIAAGGKVDPHEVVDLAKQEGVNVTLEEVAEYMDRTVSGDAPISEEEDAPTLSEIQPDQNAADFGEGTPNMDSKVEVIGYIGEAFSFARSTSSGVLGAILTSILSEFLYADRDVLIPYARKSSWFDQNVFDYYLHTGERMTQKEIAELFHKAESSISRTKTNFIERYMDIADLEELLQLSGKRANEERTK